MTVTEQVPDFPPAVAVIVTVPGDTAVTVPLLTVATAWFELAQVTVLLVAVEGLTVAVRLVEPPTSRVRELWLTHYSPSLTHPEQYLKMAETIFQQTKCGSDGLSCELDFED